MLIGLVASPILSVNPLGVGKSSLLLRFSDDSFGEFIFETE